MDSDMWLRGCSLVWSNLLAVDGNIQLPGLSGIVVVVTEFSISISESPCLENCDVLFHIIRCTGIVNSTRWNIKLIQSAT